MTNTTKQEFFESGGTAKDWEKIEGAALRRASKRQEQDLRNQESRRPASFRRARDIINWAFNWAVTLVSTLLLVGGILLSTVLIIILEIVTVESGLRLTGFEHPTLYATLILIIYASGLFIEEHLREDIGAQAKEAWSLRRVLENIRYVIGLGHWTPKQKKEPSMYEMAVASRTVIGAGIIVFAALGRVPDLAREVDNAGAARAGLDYFIQSATFIDWVTLAGTALMMWGLLRAFKFITHVVYVRFKALTGGIEDTTFFVVEEVPSIEVYVNREMKSSIENYLLEKQAQNRLPSSEEQMTSSQN